MPITCATTIAPKCSDISVVADGKNPTIFLALRFFLGLVSSLFFRSRTGVWLGQSARFFDDGLVGKIIKRFAATSGHGLLDHFCFRIRETQFGVAVQICQNFLQQFGDRLRYGTRRIGCHPTIQCCWRNADSFGDLLTRQAVRFEFFDDRLTCHWMDNIPKIGKKSSAFLY